LQYRSAYFLDSSDGLVTEHGAGRGLGHVALEDVQVGAADRRGIDAHDRVGGVEDRWIIDGVPAALPGAVIHESLHF
jgi:hypothetical protein